MNTVPAYRAAPVAVPMMLVAITLPSGETRAWEVPADCTVSIERPDLPPKHRERHLKLVP